MLYGIPPPSTALTSVTSSGQPTVQTATVPTAAASAATSSISSNAQAALMILLTAQMQSQSGEPSVLQNPQVVSILQTLVNNADKSSDMNELVKDPSLAAVFSPVGPPTAATTGSTIGLDANRPALLNTPKTRPILLGNAPPQSAAPPTIASSNDGLTASITANTPGGLDNLLNAQNLNQLLGSLNTTPTHAEASKVAPQPVVSVASMQPQPLLPTPSSTGFMQVINVTNYYTCMAGLGNGFITRALLNTVSKMPV